MTMKKCIICGGEFDSHDGILGHGIRHEIEDLIKKDRHEWDDSCFICRNDYETYRVEYVTRLVAEEKGSVKALQNDVIRSLKEEEIITSDVNKMYMDKIKTLDRVSDKVAQFGGSWGFISLFFLVLVLWIIINSITLLARPFDPYPFILLNLVLSCIAAIQAPVIMMSQNRQEAKDRLRSENDYKINLKSEIEIRTLHEKVDHLLLEQWSKMIEIQNIQIDLLNEIRNKFKGPAI